MKGQDVVIAVALAAAGRWNGYADLGRALHLSPSAVHEGVERLIQADLVDRSERVVRRRNLLEFLLHGLRYAFPAEIGGPTVGVPTSHSAPPLAERIRAGAGDVLVWPDPEGSVRGRAISPLYRGVPAAARGDPRLHEWLALLDALRLGRSREVQLARDELERRLIERAG